MKVEMLSSDSMSGRWEVQNSLEKEVKFKHPSFLTHSCIHAFIQSFFRSVPEVFQECSRSVPGVFQSSNSQVPKWKWPNLQTHLSSHPKMYFPVRFVNNTGNNDERNLCFVNAPTQAFLNLEVTKTHFLGQSSSDLAKKNYLCWN